MAVDTPVLERESSQTFTRSYEARFGTAEAHNARIKDRYARLIDPDSKIEDVISAMQTQEAQQAQQVQVAQPVQQAPYRVENARATSPLFRADSVYNAARIETGDAVAAKNEEEENEDLRPTPTTIQYQTIGEAKNQIKSTTENRTRVLGKKEKIIIAVFVSVVIALLALVVINSSIIANLNADISGVQTQIESVRGALAGVSSSVSEIVPESVRDLLLK